MLIESFPCESRDELRSREGFYIREYKTLGVCVNCIIENRTRAEWLIDNNERVRENKKLYSESHKEETKQRYENNKIMILERNKIKYTCECGCIITKRHLSRHEKTKKHINNIELINQK